MNIENKKYSITLLNLIKYSNFTIIVTFINFIIPFLNDFDLKITIPFIFLSLFFVIPDVVLIFTYIFKNYGSKLIFVQDGLLYNDITVKYNDINKIQIFRYNGYDSNFFIPNGGSLLYFFIKIYIIGRPPIYITCFMINNYNEFISHFRSIPQERISRGLMFLCRKKEMGDIFSNFQETK